MSARAFQALAGALVFVVVAPAPSIAYGGALMPSEAGSEDRLMYPLI